MIKKGLIGLGALSLLTVGVIGFEPAYSYVSTAAGMVEEGIQDSVPFEVEVSRLEHMIDELDEVIRKHQKLVLEREVDHEMIEDEIGTRDIDLSRQKTDLSQARDLLRSDNGVFAIGTRNYTRSQVQNDAVQRIEQFDADKKMLDIRKQTSATLAKALSDARIQLAGMKDKRTEYVQMLEVLRAEHLQLEAKKQLAATVQGLGLPSLDNEFGDVENLFQRLSKRIKVENEMLERLPQAANFDIDYGDVTPTTPGVLEKLDEVLDGKVEFPAEIDAGEALPTDDSSEKSVDYNPEIASNPLD